MLNVLFWNLNGRRTCERLCGALARRDSVDILILAECLDPQAVRRSVNAGAWRGRYFPHPTPPPNRLVVFSRFSRPELSLVEAGTRFAIHRLVGAHTPELLVVSVHLRSGLRATEREQEKEVGDLAERITTVERRRGHDRTVVIGDLNAQPFDLRVASATGLHGVMSRTVARRGSRQIDRVAYPFFYNPMWKVFAHRPPAPQGTYYYPKARIDQFFWHACDQVLVRPSYNTSTTTMSWSSRMTGREYRYRRRTGGPTRTSRRTTSRSWLDSPTQECDMSAGTLPDQDLWPEFHVSTEPSPLAILRQQGFKLGERTRNAVFGEVRTERDGDRFRHTLQVSAPFLDTREPPLWAEHGLDRYPVDVTLAGHHGPAASVVSRKADDAAGFSTAVKELLAHPAVVKLVDSLLAQSRDLDEDE